MLTDIQKRKLIPYRFVAPSVLLLVILMLFPIIIVIGYSFLDRVIVVKKSSFVGLANYRRLFADKTFWISLYNTTYFTITSVFFHLLIGLAFALMLNSEIIPNWIRSICRVFFIMPWVFTVTIVAILWRLLLNPEGIINHLMVSSGIFSQRIEFLSDIRYAMFSIIFINIWAGYPYFMVTILAGLQGISKDYYEAATLDGANGFQKFFYITIPQLRPILLSISMLDTIWTMRVFALVWMTTGGGPIIKTEVLGTQIYKTAFSMLNFTGASASSVIILIISIVLSFFYIKAQKAREE